jgi:hypothetical protein
LSLPAGIPRRVIQPLARVLGATPKGLHEKVSDASLIRARTPNALNTNNGGTRALPNQSTTSPAKRQMNGAPARSQHGKPIAKPQTHRQPRSWDTNERIRLPNSVHKVPEALRVAQPQLPKRAAQRTVAVPQTASKSIQTFASRVVQATKFYPNLHPGAVEPIDGSNVFRLASFANQYRLHKVNSHGVNVPNQQYNFVRTREGDMLLHARYRHPSIAEGKQVLYAGEIFFNNGKLQWWSNGSGHYQPGVEDAEQANLPMDHFFSFQQIIKGEHTRKKG